MMLGLKVIIPRFQSPDLILKNQRSYGYDQEYDHRHNLRGTGLPIAFVNGRRGNGRIVDHIECRGFQQMQK
jgi:hypothetical protein